MKPKALPRIYSFTGAFLLALLLACKPAADTNAQQTAAPAAPAPAAGMVRYEASPTGSEMKIEGTANIKDWSMKSILLGGYIEADPKFPGSALTDPKAARPVVNVYMPVRAFKSGNSAMDGRMQKEMKETQFKRIEYKLIELKPKSAAGATGKLDFDATGTLTVVGQTRTNTMPVSIEKQADGKLKVSGTTKVKMTDFGITPPSTALLFTSGDEVTLKFDWLTAPKAP